MGDLLEEPSGPSNHGSLVYGQGITSSVGASHTLQQVYVVLWSGVFPSFYCIEYKVPGLYDGRPERYFDSRSDPRQQSQARPVQDHQRTRDVSYIYQFVRITILL